jgi:hypothetical protein
MYVCTCCFQTTVEAQLLYVHTPTHAAAAPAAPPAAAAIILYLKDPTRQHPLVSGLFSNGNTTFILIVDDLGFRDNSNSELDNIEKIITDAG